MQTFGRGIVSAHKAELDILSTSYTYNCCNDYDMHTNIYVYTAQDTALRIRSANENNNVLYAESWKSIRAVCLIAPVEIAKEA